MMKNVMMSDTEAAFQRCSYKKGVLKLWSKFTGEHPLQTNFTEITLRHGCSLVNLRHIFGPPFPKNTPGGLLLVILYSVLLNVYNY